MTNDKKLESLPYDHLKLSSDEIARLSPVRDAVLADDTEELRRLIQSLSPPVSYLQKQFDSAIRQVKLAAARCLVEEGVEIDGGILFTACYATKSVDTIESIRVFELLLELGWNVNVFWDSMPTLG